MDLDKYLVYVPQFVIGFIFTLILTPAIIYLTRKFNVFDLPSNQRLETDGTKNRRIHEFPTPKLGGLAVIIPFIILSAFFLNFTPELAGFLILCLFLAFVGAVDDLFHLKAAPQFVAQIIAALGAALVLNMPKIIIPPLGEIHLDILTLNFGIFNFNFISDFLIMLWIIVLINSVKFNAGADAVMEGNVLIAFVIIFLIAVRIQDPITGTLSSIISGSLFAFLFFVWSPAKIFTAGSGKMVYGFIIGILAIYSESKLSVAISLTALPIIDAIIVLTNRYIKHRPKNILSIMRINDTTHLHHFLMKAGFSHRKIALVEWSLTLLFGAIAFLTAGSMRAVSVMFIVLGATMFLLLIRKENINNKLKERLNTRK